MICKLEKGVTSFTRLVVDKLNKYYGISLVPLKFKCSLVVYRDKKEWYVRINDIKTITIEEHLANCCKKKT